MLRGKLLQNGLAVIVATCVLFATSLTFCLSARATPTGSLAKIRSEYVRLKNVDPSGDSDIHRAAWEVLATRMRGVLVQHSTVADDVAVRLMGADTHMRLYRSTRQQSYLTAARAMLSPLVQASGSSGASEEGLAGAFLLFGDLNVYSGFKDSAVQAYERAAGVRSGGMVSGVAQQRLQSLRNRTFERFIPSRDFEIPVPIPWQAARRELHAKAPLVVLDPGHGGDDAGAVSAVGGKEKEVTLDIARRVKVLLERRHGIQVRLTRHADQFVPLARRTAFANRKKADVFVSLHVNASETHDAEGLEVYYLDTANDEASRKLAERENGIAAGEGVDDLSFMLSDLIQTGKLEDSIVLSRSLDTAMRKSVISSHKGLRSLGVKKAPFFVLVGAHMPCTLLEMFFIDHPSEGRKFQEESFRSALALGIAEGIKTFLQKSY
jgi:N-acetylmuramoyl-L-alanine amidase